MIFKDKDFSVSTYVAERNWTSTKIGVRVIHMPTGEFEQCSDNRSDHANKEAAWLKLAAKLESMPEPAKPSYHDLHIETRLTPRTSISDLPFNIKITCTRVGGWELWSEDRLIAGEYNNDGLRLDVKGHIIVDSLTGEINHA